MGEVRWLEHSRIVRAGNHQPLVEVRLWCSSQTGRVEQPVRELADHRAASHQALRVPMREV